MPLSSNSRRGQYLLVAASASNGASWQGSQPQGQARQPQPRLHPMPPYSAWPATAKVALRTGAYITVLGLAIFLLPGSLFGAFFDARCAPRARHGLPLLHLLRGLQHGSCSFIPALQQLHHCPCAPPPPNRSRVALGWVRVGGVLASLFGAYYVGAALDDAAGRQPLYFYRATVVGRLLLSAAFTYLVASGQCEAGLLALAAANALSSLALHRALQQQHRAT